jgi:hypothetical protein
MSVAGSTRWQIVLRALALLMLAGLTIFLAGRYRVRVDLSPGARHSLAQETVRLLAALPEDPQLTFYLPDREPERSRLAALLGACQARRPGLSWSIVDPGREPAKALAAGVRESGVVTVAVGEVVERFVAERDGAGIHAVLESDLARAFLSLARGGGALCRIVQGPGIRGLAGANGLTAMKSMLELDGHRVEPWSPLSTAGTGPPPDTDLLILPGPHLRLPAAILAGLESHLAAGGALLLMLDPAAEMADSSVDAGLGPLLAARGLRAGPGFVVDLGEENIKLGKGFEVPVVSRYAPHPVTRRFLERSEPTCFPLARVFDPIEGAAVTPQGLLLSSDRSFEERGPFDGKAHHDEGVDRRGPFVLAAASDSSAAGGGPLLVIGDSNFIGNADIDWYGNGGLLLSAVAWLSREQLRPELAMPAAPAQLLPITPGGRRLYALISLLILPALTLSVWPLRVLLRRRRGRGVGTRGES